MRSLLIAAVALLALHTLAGTAPARTWGPPGPVSGPQAGEKVPGPFKCLNINGPEAGQKACLYCRYGSNPVVMIFAREVTPALRTLIQRLEAITAANTERSLGSCVIFCNESESLPGQLAQLAQADRLKHVTLAVCKATGPTNYKIAPEADITVLLYTQATVVANHAFRKGELTDNYIEFILALIPGILSSR